MKKKKTPLEKRLTARMEQKTGLLETENTKKLDPTLAKEFSGMFGGKNKDIRIHTGPEAANLTHPLNARALAFDSGDIYFAPNQFQPKLLKERPCWPTS